jgi:hypothetical protein
MAVSMALAGCGSPSLAPESDPVTPSTEASRPTEEPTATAAAAPAQPCATGRLTVGDLPKMDAEWAQGLEQATTRAKAWNEDVVLSSLRVSCQLFEAGFRWQAQFYSRSAQAFFLSDTGEIEPANVEPDAVPLLPTEELSFASVHRAMVRSNIDDGATISASSGVDVRVNSERAPFGPPDAPKDTILYHLAVERLGQTLDLFVDAGDGTVYVYQP